MTILHTECPSLSSTTPNDEQVYSEALTTCGRLKNSTAAMEILDQIPDSDICRARTISICGQNGRLADALELLLPASKEDDLKERDKTDRHECVTSGPYNSAIAACGNCKHWKGALYVLAIMPPHLVTTVTMNAVLTALAKERRGTEALALLQAMTYKWNIQPDRTSYHNTLSALLGNDQIEESCRLVHEMAQGGRPEIVPNKDTYNRIASAVAGKEAARAIVVDKLGDQIDVQSQSREFADFQKWKLPKVGRGKSAYWKLGQFMVEGEENPIIVGLSPNRNPATNGMRLNFYRQGSGTRDKKLGYLIMINTRNDDKAMSMSQFLGQWVTPDERGHGWAKVWLAIWFTICLDAGIRPTTGKMHKPLLCLVLQHSFDMQPMEDADGGRRGVEVELSPGDKTTGSIVLYSSSRALEGVFSPLDLRKQNMKLSLVPSNPRGRKVVVGTSFQGPSEDILREKVDKILRDRWTLVDEAKTTTNSLYEIMLGT